MNLIGTIIRQTEKAVLFAGDPLYDKVFQGEQLWWPMSQIELFEAGDNGPTNTARLITSKWIAESKARELGRTVELEAEYKEFEAAQAEERREKQAKRNGKKLAKELRTLRAAGVDEKEAFLRTYGHYPFKVNGEWWDTLRTPDGDVSRKRPVEDA